MAPSPWQRHIVWILGPRLWQAQMRVPGRGGQFTQPWGVPALLVFTQSSSGLPGRVSSLPARSESASVRASNCVLETLIHTAPAGGHSPPRHTRALSQQVRSERGGQAQTCPQGGELFSQKCQQTCMQLKRQTGENSGGVGSGGFVSQVPKLNRKSNSCLFLPLCLKISEFWGWLLVLNSEVTDPVQACFLGRGYNS